MISRTRALENLDQWVTKNFTRRHLLATEAVMRAYVVLKSLRNRTNGHSPSLSLNDNDIPHNQAPNVHSLSGMYDSLRHPFLRDAPVID